MLTERVNLQSVSPSTVMLIKNTVVLRAGRIGQKFLRMCVRAESIAPNRAIQSIDCSVVEFL